MARSEAPASAKAAGNSYHLCLPPPRQSSTLHESCRYPNCVPLCNPRPLVGAHLRHRVSFVLNTALFLLVVVLVGYVA